MPVISHARPIIGISPDSCDNRYRLAHACASCIERSGAVPVVLPHHVALIDSFLSLCQGFVLSGGDDPDMTPFGVATDPRATVIDARRQEFDVALLRAAHDRPVLGICLGMQLMGLVAGGRLDQYLPDSLPTHEVHFGRREHDVSGALGSGSVYSHHRQALIDPGRLEVVAVAPDGVIEAVRDPEGAFHLGVQWHPERTTAPALGIGIFQALTDACRPLAYHRPE